jgi:hypothetical protein
MMLARRVVFVASFAASSAVAQTVSGRVVDSATGRPIPGAGITLQNGRTVVASRTANDSGRFDISAPSAGRYDLRIRRLGFRPESLSVQLAAGATVTGTYRLRPLPVTLDTVRSSDRTSFFHVTPGRVKYAEHLKLSLGQMVSGLEIQRSKLPVTEFLGKMPGFRLVPLVPVPKPYLPDINSPLTIPGAKGYLLTTTGTGCLVGRIDHWSIVQLLDQDRANDIDEVLKVEDIMGIELYETVRTIPREWQFAGFQGVAWRWSALGHYFMGDTRLTNAPSNPKRTRDSRLATQIVAEGNDLGFRQSIPLGQLAAPACGFVQIWTRISW